MSSGGQGEVLERLARLEEKVEAVRNEVAEVGAKIDGPPWERSLRGRMHVMEAEGSAAKIAAAALAEARRERRKAEDARWNWRWKLFGGATSLALVAAPYVALWRHG